jgi:hypothetical protein
MQKRARSGFSSPQLGQRRMGLAQILTNRARRRSGRVVGDHESRRENESPRASTVGGRAEALGERFGARVIFDFAQQARAEAMYHAGDCPSQPISGNA